MGTAPKTFVFGAWPSPRPGVAEAGKIDRGGAARSRRRGRGPVYFYCRRGGRSPLALGEQQKGAFGLSESPRPAVTDLCIVCQIFLTFCQICDPKDV